jgi:hypothetical protein
MAGWQDEIDFGDDFQGAQLFPTSATAGTLWKLSVTGAAPPTAAVNTPSNGGEVLFTLTSAAQVQNLCLDFADRLTFDIDQLKMVEFRVKCSAGFTSNVSLGFGLQSARNDDLDATTQHAQFRLKGNNNVLVETDDNVIDNNTVATGKTLAAAYKRFVIDFSKGKSDLRFYVDGEVVAPATRLSMANYSGSLQPFIQLQKASSADTGTATLDYVKVLARRY